MSCYPTHYHTYQKEVREEHLKELTNEQVEWCSSTALHSGPDPLLITEGDNSETTKSEDIL